MRLRQYLRDALELGHNLRLVHIDIDSVALPQPDDFVTGTIVEPDGEQTVLSVATLNYALMHSKEDSSEFGMPLS